MEKWEEEREGEREKRSEEEQKERTYSHLHGGSDLNLWEVGFDSLWCIKISLKEKLSKGK